MPDLRLITVEDIAAIKKWPAYAGDFRQLDYALRENGWLDEFINRPDTWIYAAESNRQIVGFSMLIKRADGNDAEFRIAIHPHRLGSGLGRKITLLTLGKGFCGFSLDKVRLIVRKNNHPAISLYESLGFKRTGEAVHPIQGERIEFIDMEMARGMFHILGPEGNGRICDMKEALKAMAIEAGAASVGIADLAAFKNEGWPVIPAGLLDPYEKAISIAMRLDDAVMDCIENAPTADYASHYRAVNAALDDITQGLVEWIRGQGFKAAAIPASSMACEENLMGNISHKAVARMAGIGWQGKSLLIVSPEHGPRIRLSTVLTDMPLPVDRPLKNRCGQCSECAKACPASAIKNVSTTARYESREDALYLGRCSGKLVQFKALPKIGARICGVCVKVCPFGKRKMRP